MMSASDPPTSSSRLRHGSSSRAANAASKMVRPTAVTERSLLESVAGFINDVQAFNVHGTMGQGRDPKVNVTWARFDVADVNDASLGLSGAAAGAGGGDVNGNVPALLLLLGYTQGVQIWLIPQTGEAQELLSWKQGVVKTLRVLPTPETRHGYPDNNAHCRPLICLTDSTGPSAPFSVATFISLKTGEQVHHIKFNNEIVDLAVNKHVVVATFREKLAVFDSANFAAKFHISFCYPSPGIDPNPISLGDRWMAYADQRLLPVHRSFGGLETDSSQSMAAWGINVGSKLAQGVSKIYSNFFSSTSPSSSPSTRTGQSHQGIGPNSPTGQVGGTGGGPAGGRMGGPQKGVVTVLDLLAVPNVEGEELGLVDQIPGVVAHFIAHNKAIVALQFDSTGNLLLTCDSAGHYFNLFRIFPFPAGSSFSAVHHLYSLYRGDTPGSVQDIAFSSDNRLVAVSTLRGTTHLFPVTPYGGPVGVRTHTAPRVVNRLSRFHRSAGIDEHRSHAAAAASSSGRNSPNPSLPGTSPVVGSFSSLSKLTSMGLTDLSGLAGGAGGTGSGPPLVIPYPNPYIPPFPTPTLVQPLAQLRQPYIVTLTNQTIGSASSVSRKKSLTSPGSSEDMVSVRLAVTFGPSRAWLVGTQHHMFNRQQRRAHESLFVMASHGVLLEYTLDVIPDPTLPKEKICETSPVELRVTAHGQWALSQPRDCAQLQPPLPIDSPLMLTTAGHANPSYGQAGEEAGSDDGGEAKWLSQVEITTHVGPHRRLWMGPQFCFKTLQPAAGGDDKYGAGEQVVDLDISLPNRPEQSTPVNMPPSMKPASHGRVPILIEASSASSFELSPRFSNAFSRQSAGAGGGGDAVSAAGGRSGSREALPGMHDLEQELQEAMSETVVGESSLLDGPASSSSSSKRKGSYRAAGKRQDDEEFFCLGTPEDCRSLGSASSTTRSRNASATSQQSAGVAVAGGAKGPSSGQQQSHHSLPVQMELPDTKIFSVAVEEGSVGRKSQSGRDPANKGMKVCSVDTSGRAGLFAVVSKDSPPEEKPSQRRAPRGEHEGESRAGASSKQIQLEPVLKAVPAPAASQASSASSTMDQASSASSGKKSRKKNKKKQQQQQQAGKSNISSDDTLANEEEPTPASSGMPAAADDNLLDFEEVPKSSQTEAPSRAEEETADHGTSASEEFLPVRRGTLTTDEDEEESSSPSFTFKEPPMSANASSKSDVDEEVRPEASEAKPAVPGWLDDPIGDPEKSVAIIKGIMTSEERWEETGKQQAAQQKSGAPEGGAPSEGAGFGVDSLLKKSLQDSVDNSSEDDFDFRPAVSWKQRKKQQQQKGGSNGDMRSRASSFADSESSLPADEHQDEAPAELLPLTPAKDSEDCKEGWSFEADDRDVTRLIEQVVGMGVENEPEEEEGAAAKAVEKTPLEDVFKFDSELVAVGDDDGEDQEAEEGEEDAGEGGCDGARGPAFGPAVKKSASLEDLYDEGDESEDAANGRGGEKRGGGGKKMTTSLNVTFDEENLVSSSSVRESLAGTSAPSSVGGGGNTSESSVGSSPNPKKTVKNKKKKKKRTF